MIHARPAVTLAAWMAGGEPGHDLAKVVDHPVPRMTRAPALTVIPVGDLVVDTERKLATSSGTEIKLKGKEYHILEHLSLHLGEPASAETLVEHLYGGIDTPEAKIVDFFIAKLRRKIDLAGGKTTIVMIPRRGYLLHTLSEAGNPSCMPAAASARS